VFPIGMCRPPGGEANKVHQQRQPASVVPRRHIDIEDSLDGIAEHVAFQHAALELQAMNLSWRCGVILTHIRPLALRAPTIRAFRHPPAMTVFRARGRDTDSTKRAPRRS